VTAFIKRHPVWTAVIVLAAIHVFFLATKPAASD
jgi:hypothetical protein